jgi:hypothetical protein
LKEGMPEKAKQNVLQGVTKKALEKLYKRDVLMD